MANLAFDDETGRLQRALAQCTDILVRRNAVLGALNLRTGEDVLELGCGSWPYAYEIAQFVGPNGRVAAIDISADQVAAARERCAPFPWAECRVADATDLPFGDREFDAVCGVQVIEYVRDVEKALREACRVLRPGGRFICLATNWSSVVWHSVQPLRMRQVLDAFSSHAPHPDLPAILGAALRHAGFQPTAQCAVPIVNMSFTGNSFSTFLAKIIATYVVSCGALTPQVAEEWLDEFTQLDEQREYFFSSTPILTEAIRIT